MRNFSIILLLFISIGNAQMVNARTHAAGVAIPAVYQDLYTQLQGDLAAFSTAIDWHGSPYPVLYTGELEYANANVGPQMLNAMPYIQKQLLALKALGYKAVAIEAGFPMLYEPFYAVTSPTKDGSCPGDSGVAAVVQQQQWASFYSGVAAAARALGLQVIVSGEVMDIGSQLSGSGSWAACLTNWYPTLGWTEFQIARAASAVALANALTPDYFVLAEEPNTEANTTGYAEITTPAGAVTMLDLMLASVLPLKLQIPNMRVGAGFGNFQMNYQTMGYAYTSQSCSSSQPCVTPKLDFFDMHVFLVNLSAPAAGPNPPVPTNFQQNALAMIGIAKAANMPVTVSQAWLRKVRDSEWQNPSSSATSNVQEARETYSFWAPLDSAWLTVFESLADYGQMIFAVPFDTPEMSAYQTWSDTTSIQEDGGVLPATQVYSNEAPVASATMESAAYSQTGKILHNSIAPGDTIPPSVPGSLTYIVTSKSSVSLSWDPSSDNVGVAGYHVWRGSVRLPDTFSTTIPDSNILQEKSYLYQVEAFDLAGNVSQPASVTVYLK